MLESVNRLENSNPSTAAPKAPEGRAKPPASVQPVDLLQLDRSWLPPPHKEPQMQPRSRLGHALAVVCLVCVQVLLWPLDKLRDGLTWLAGRQSVRAALRDCALQSAATAARQQVGTEKKIGEETRAVAALRAQAAGLNAAIVASNKELDALRVPVTQARDAEARLVTTKSHLECMQAQAVAAQAEAKAAQVLAQTAQARAQTALGEARDAYAEVDALQGAARAARAEAKNSHVDAHAWRVRAQDAHGQFDYARQLTCEAQAVAQNAWAQALDLQARAHACEAAYQKAAGLKPKHAVRALLYQVSLAERRIGELETQRQRILERNARVVGHLGILSDQIHGQPGTDCDTDGADPKDVNNRLIRHGLESVARSLRQA